MNGNQENIIDTPHTVVTENTPVENAGGNTPATPKPVTPQPAVQEITANVDLTRKPETKKETINLLDDDQLDADVNRNTEGDIKKQQEAKKTEPDLNAFRQQTNPSASSDPKAFNPTTAKQQADAWVKIIDIGMRFGLKAWSGQADNTGLEPADTDKQILAEQLSIAMAEYKVVMPILVTVLTTFGAMYATPIMNARESKKKIDEFRASEEAKKAKKLPAMKPELDPATGKHIKKKGGQYKAT